MQFKLSAVRYQRRNRDFDARFYHEDGKDLCVIKRVVPTGVQGSPSELNFFTTFLRLLKELNPEPFDRRKF
jgi:hypothetical protein